VKPVNQVAAVDQIELVHLTNIFLSVAVTLVGNQILDFPIGHLHLQHVNEALREVVSFHMAENSAEFKSSATWSASSIQS
jgi:hypothetical protein